MYSHTLNDTKKVFTWTVHLVEILALNGSAAFHCLIFSLLFKQTLILNLSVNKAHPDHFQNIIAWIM